MQYASGKMVQFSCDTGLGSGSVANSLQNFSGQISQKIPPLAKKFYPLIKYIHRG
jgi:hypothetical protein